MLVIVSVIERRFVRPPPVVLDAAEALPASDVAALLPPAPSGE